MIFILFAIMCTTKFLENPTFCKLLMFFGPFKNKFFYRPIINTGQTKQNLIFFGSANQPSYKINYRKKADFKCYW